MTNQKLGLYLVDDQDLFRAGLTMLLGSQTDFAVVGEAADGNSALQSIPHVNPDIVLMDIRMPLMDGLETTRHLVRHYKQLGKQPPQILILTTLDTEESAREALAAGAHGFMLKNAEPELLISAVRAMGQGTRIVATAADLTVPPATKPTKVPTNFERLTDRERDVFLALSHGLNNREIAATLFLAEATVKTHITSILQKLQLRDRVQIVVYAYQHGIATV